MKSKIYKKLILLIASVLLVITVISAATLGWFYNNKNAYIKDIVLSIDAISELEITSKNIKYIVPGDYNNSGIAPGCLGYFTLSIKNPNENTPASFSIKADLSNSKIPSNLHIYKGNFNPNNASVTNKQNIYWSSGSYISGTGTQTIFQGSANAGETIEYTIAFFWPYDANSNPSKDVEFARNPNSFMLKLFVAS